jgi:hypothetical protein
MHPHSPYSDWKLWEEAPVRSYGRVLKVEEGESGLALDAPRISRIHGATGEPTREQVARA